MKQVLIVDDSSFMRKLISKILVKNGYIVAGEAENGISALQQYKELSPDIVTLDITMKEKNGIDVLKDIIEYDSSANVIMVSSMGQTLFVQEAVKNGAKGFIIKPFKEENVISAINNI